MSLRALLWSLLGRHAFAWTFHNWYGARRNILRVFGAKLTATSKQRPTCTITCPWNLTMGVESAIGDYAFIDSDQPVSIGDYCTVSQYAKVLTRARVPGSELRAPIRIETDAWVAADSIVFPGVTLGPGAILGSRAAAMRDLSAWTIFGGEPLRAIGARPRVDL
ncbi:MAG: hypothetical protein U0573_03805 [Phycisphaerales bacterium]|nr:putative colanic acid biosynthesis acetyltransferase [Planctomycetota bacterium]